ncbi:MAG: hypothetical protein WC642_01280 [Nocardioides sp.]
MSDLRAGPVLRLARGLLTATVAGGLGLGAHVAAGGLLPPATWLILIYAALAAVVIASLGVPAGLFRLVLLVGGGQFATHLMLTAVAGHAGDHRPVRASARHREELVSTPGTGRRGSLHDLTMGQVEPPSGGEFVVPHWLTHILDDLTGPHAAMAVAHLAAAAVVAWWLAQGESALWTILVLLGASFLRRLTRRGPVHGFTASGGREFTTRIAAAQQRLRRLLAPLTGGLGRRGPPLIVI